MTQPAAFRATYSDLRFVKTRKVCQIVLEMPLESADAFLSAFGTPNPAEEKWCALARLETDLRADAIRNDEPAHKRWDEIRRTAQAAIRCSQPLFWEFFCVGNKRQAEEKVRWACEVDSRSKLDSDINASSKWDEIEAQFMEWKRRRKL